MGSIGSGQWPDGSPSLMDLRQNSFNFPPTPSPVAFRTWGGFGMGDGTAAAVTGATGAQQCHNQFRGSQQGLHQQGQLQQNQQQSQFQQMYFVQMPMMMPAGTQVPLQEQGQAPMLTTALPATTMMP